MTTMVEKILPAVERELGTQEMILTDPMTLRRMMAKRVTRAVLTALLEPSERMLEECGNGIAAQWAPAIWRVMIQAALVEGEG